MSPLSVRTRLGYGVGHVLNDLCSSLWFTYLLIFFHKVERFPNTLAGVVLLIGQVADAISTPFVGYQADRTDDTAFCIRYGRRKTWHLTGTVCVLCAFPFIFMGCLGCELSDPWFQVLYFSPFVVVFQFGWAATQISHLALIPSLSNDPLERTSLNAIRYAFTVFANISVYLIAWLSIGLGSNRGGGGNDHVIGPSDAYTFKIIVAAVLSLGAVFSVIFHIVVKEDNVPEPPRPSSPGSSRDPCNAVSNSSYAPALQYGKERVPKRPADWFKDRQFYVVAVVYMCTRLFCNLSQAYIPVYLQDTLLLSPASVAYIPLVMYVAGLLATFAIRPLNRRLGRKVAYVVGSAFGVLGCVGIYIGHGALYQEYFLYVVAVLLGAGASVMLVTSLSITADLIGNNIESCAFVYGAMSFTDKLSNGLAVMVIQVYSPYSPLCPHCLFYYRDILTFVCGSACVAGGFFVLFQSTAPTETIRTIRTAGSDEHASDSGSDNEREEEVAPLIVEHHRGSGARKRSGEGGGGGGGGSGGSYGSTSCGAAAAAVFNTCAVSTDAATAAAAAAEV